MPSRRLLLAALVGSLLIKHGSSMILQACQNSVDEHWHAVACRAAQQRVQGNAEHTDVKVVIIPSYYAEHYVAQYIAELLCMLQDEYGWAILEADSTVKSADMVADIRDALRCTPSPVVDASGGSCDTTGASPEGCPAVEVCSAVHAILGLAILLGMLACE